MSRFAIRSGLALTICMVFALTGCSLQAPLPSYASARGAILEIRDSIQATVPSEEIIGSDDFESSLPCSGDGEQFDGVRTLTVDSSFDMTAWLDALAVDFKAKGDWRVERSVDAEGLSEATRAVALFSDDGRYLRAGAFASTPTGAKLVLSASSVCSEPELDAG